MTAAALLKNILMMWVNL